MKAPNSEGKLRQQGLQHRFEKGFADLLHRSYHLPLCDLVHHVDVIHPLLPILSALMHGVDPQVSRAPQGLRFSPFPNRYCRWPRRLILDMPLPIRPASPESVQVRHRDPSQAFVSRVVEVVAGPLLKFLRGWPAQGLMVLVLLAQQYDVLPCVSVAEPAPPLVP